MKEIRLAGSAGFCFGVSRSVDMAEKLIGEKGACASYGQLIHNEDVVARLAESGLRYALDIFRSIGVYLGHTLCLYARLYDIRNLIVLGRVASGVGGDLIVSECQRVLKEEYPELAQKLRVMLPDENFRRVGQSMAAASLPEV